MEIIENCWDEIETYNCQYGAHIFDGSSAKIYVNHWLDVSNKMSQFFCRKNNEGFVGHCLLVFHGVKNFDFVVKQWNEKNGEIIWNEPIAFRYVGATEMATRRYEFEGSLHGFPSSVLVVIEAQAFALHILEADEPARSS
jgi:hypothetical protein